MKLNKIVIINQHSLNYGDDMAGISLVQAIETYINPEQIDIIYNTPGQIPILDDVVRHRRDLSLKTIGILPILFFMIGTLLNINILFGSKIKYFVNEIKKANVIFVSPSGANLGIYKDWRFLIKLLLAKVSGVDIVFCNNTIGKSNSIIFNFFENKILKYSNLYVRERKSFDFLKDNGYHPILGVDTAFSLNSVDNNIGKMVKKNDYITFIPTELGWHPDFKKSDVTNLLFTRFLPKLCEFQIEHNFDLKIVPHKYGEAYEAKLLESIEKRIIELGVSKEKINICKVSDCFDYENILKNSKYNVTMRYHGAVMSIKNGVPFLSLQYENKMKEVADYSGVGELNIPIERAFEQDFRISDEYKKAERKICIMKMNSNYLRRISLLPVKQQAFILKNRVM